MLLGILSDPHANLPALQTVLGDVERVRPDSLICLGDFVGYGAQPNEVVAALKGRCSVSLLGNHDLVALGKPGIDVSDFNPAAAQSAQWTRDQLDATTRDFLANLQPRERFEGLELAHASLRDPIWEYILDQRVAAANFEAFDFDIAIVGHTHVPAIYRLVGGSVDGIYPKPDEVHSIDRGRFLLNPGGIGQPRDGDPRASWATLDTEARTFTVRRLDYPITEAQRAIREAGLPPILADRLSTGQ